MLLVHNIFGLGVASFDTLEIIFNYKEHHSRA